MEQILKMLTTQGDLAHLALFCWASSATSLLVWSLKALLTLSQRFNQFLQEIQRANHLLDP